VLPLTPPPQPLDWLAAAIHWSTSGIRPVSVGLGPLAELSTPGRLPSPSRGQFRPLLLLGERIQATLNPTSTTSLPSGFYTPETLAAYPGVSTSTICSWNSSGHGPPFVKLGRR
jgi:hypothetical protein